MKVKQTRKVSFRVAPEVWEGLRLVAEIADIGDMTIADFIRSCVNYGLTRDPKHLPRYFRNDSYGELPLVNDARGWKEFKEFLEEL